MKLLVEQEHKKRAAIRMKILLFNDNPVVRKLVALSAQKTKDELSVVWSIDEIQESDYDLLIVDDAIYNDVMFSELQEVVSYKSSLLMATRGQAVPSGFDNVIHKPFLPTDLVDMFIQIEKKIFSASAQSSVKEVSAEPELSSSTEQEPFYAINLEETLPDLSSGEDNLELDDLESFDLGDLEGEINLTVDDDLDLEGLESIEDEMAQTAILDKEEVQEVQNLLDDAESDEWTEEEEIEVKPIDEMVNRTYGLEDTTEFSEEDLLSEETELPQDDDILAEDFVLDDALEDQSLVEDAEEPLPDDLVLDESLDGELELEIPDDLLLDDEELGDLESQIESAVNTLEPEMLNSELELGDFDLDLDDSLMEDLELSEVKNDEMQMDDADPFDLLDEKELKRAVGEEVEEEVEAEAEPIIEEVEDIFDDTLETVVEEVSQPREENSNEIKPSHAEGVEALQALLKALTNEEVAKSLKALNISININFGNEA